MSARELVSRLGGDASAALGLDLEHGDDVERWFVAACLLSGRVKGGQALDAARALANANLAGLARIASAGSERVALALDAARYPKPEAAALKLARAADALARQGRSLGEIGAGADDLEDLGSQLSRLAPGVGTATVLTFLRPLRDLWPAARETPLSPAAQAAAVHLGFVAPGADEEGEPGALRAALAEEDDAPPLAAVEAALDALGRSHCLRERAARCPLPEVCPLAHSGVARTEPQE
jgi:hypothetical protein